MGTAAIVGTPSTTVAYRYHVDASTSVPASGETITGYRWDLQTPVDNYLDVGFASAFNIVDTSFNNDGAGSYTATVAVYFTDELFNETIDYENHNFTLPNPILASGNANFTLFIGGHESLKNQTFDLSIPYTLATSSGIFPLYVAGGEDSPSGDFTLYEYGHDFSSGVFPLYIHGKESSSGNFDLSIAGVYENSNNINLFLQTDPILYDSESLSLSLVGTANSGVFGGVDFYTYAAVGDNVASGNIPLSIKAVDEDFGVGYLNCWINGSAYEINNSFDLYLNNAQSGIFSNFNLYVSGEGISEGWNTNNGNMPLFIQRPDANSFDLYIKSQGYDSSGVFNLHTFGDSPVVSSLNFALPSGVGYKQNNTRLYVNGW